MADSPSTPSSNPAPSTPAQNTPNTSPQAQGSTNPASAPQAAAKDAKAVINDPNASKAAKVEAKKTLKQLSIKVDGQEFTENLPFEIPDTKEAREYMARELQMSRMGQKRASHAATLEKEVKQLIKDMKEDPFKVLADPAVGIDVKAAVQKFIEQEIENSKKSPEQLELEATKAEIKRLREEQENEKRTAAEQDRQKLADQYEQEYDTQITAALNANKIPKSEAAVKKILAYAELAVQANKDVNINDIIPFVQEELVNDYRSHAAALPDDALEEFLGKEIFDRIRKASVAKAKKAQQNPGVKAPTKAPDTGKTEVKSGEPVKKIAMKDFFKGLG